MLALYSIHSTNLQCEIRVILCNEYELQPLLENFARETKDLLFVDKLTDVYFKNKSYCIPEHHDATAVNGYAYSKDYRVKRNENQQPTSAADANS